jgi:hypothetical protein
MIKASACEEILQRVVALFGESGFPDDRESRWRRLYEVPEETRAKLAELDREMWADPDRLLCKLYYHVVANLQDFRAVSPAPVISIPPLP